MKVRNMIEEPGADTLLPAKIQRATANMDQVKEFYSTDIGIKELTNWQNADGSTTVTFMYDKPHKSVQLQFTQGAKSFSEKDDEFTVADFESYMMSVHKKVMVNQVCGFDQWIDNHYAFDGDIRDGYRPTMLDVYARHAEKLGLPYHWWKTPNQ